MKLDRAALSVIRLGLLVSTLLVILNGPRAGAAIPKANACWVCRQAGRIPSCQGVYTGWQGCYADVTSCTLVGPGCTG
jgi:hypothetical protein